MTKSQFSYSHDEEHFYGSFATPEEAAHEGLCGEYDRCFVGENYTPDAESYLDADLLIEHVSCQDEYCVDAAEGWPNETKTQRDQLTTSLRK